jgi:hypothetical protein
VAGAADVAVPEIARASNPPRLPRAGAWSSGDYWAFADWAFGAVDRIWNEKTGFYGQDIRTSSTLLGAHALAAQAGYAGGPLRNDERARRIAAQLLQVPPFKPALGASTGTTNPRSVDQSHAPGWTAATRTNRGTQHVAIDPKVAEGLGRAWLAREQLGLLPETVALIPRRIASVAAGRFFRYPNIRLNQVNWYLELYLWAAVTSGDWKRWLPQFRAQLDRWCDGATRVRKPWLIPNFGPSWNFHREPFGSLNSKQNIESTEYACISLEVLAHIREARAHGLSLSASQRRFLRAWPKRALWAYFTHSGYLQWDTGMFLERWHLARYWAWSLSGLLALMQHADARQAREAKWIFDRALETYARWASLRGDAVPPTRIYPISPILQPSPAELAARFATLAARAAVSGVGSARGSAPGPRYAYDPSIGRLTITTPSYNCAIVAQSNGAFPYGGLDICRLSDAKQRVAASIGGTGAANFGLTVTGTGGRRLVSTAGARTHGGPPPLELTRGPRGRIVNGKPYPSEPYAGGFSTLEVTGARSGGGATVRSTTEFNASRILTTWTARRTRSRDALTVTATLPTYGTDATITAVTKAGDARTLDVGSAPVALRNVAYFWLRSGGDETGYVAVPRRFPTRARATVVRPARQPAAPLPGPTLVIELVHADRRFRVATLQVALAVASTASQAARVARALGA